MSLIDNNPKLDDEIEDLMECLLFQYPEHQPAKKWFTLRALYQNLGVKFTLRRQGSLDAIIEKTLSDWNWHRHHSEYWGISYIRRDYPTKPVSFYLWDGTQVTTEFSWPTFLPPVPESRQGSDSDAASKKLRGTVDTEKPNTLRLVAKDGILVA